MLTTASPCPEFYVASACSYHCVECSRATWDSQRKGRSCQSHSSKSLSCQVLGDLCRGLNAMRSRTTMSSLLDPARHPSLLSFLPFTRAPPGLPSHFINLRIWERVITFNSMAEGVPHRAHEATIDLVSELFQLGWSPKAIGRGIRSVPRRHSSAYISTIRSFGRELIRSTSALEEYRESGEIWRSEVYTVLSLLYVSLSPRPICL